MAQLNNLVLHSVAFILSGFISFTGYSQSPVQNIKGTVTDMDSHQTLPGAAVVILNSNPVIGTTTDNNGIFKFTGIRTGRYDLQFTYLGYETTVISEVLVESGKEVVLEVRMKESAVSISQVEIKAFRNKEHAVNPMAMISARQLTMEEASRYAGGIDDPARLATSFAGVAGSLSSNAIVIRGNAPKGLLWRMEGVEIPNPSHFANVSTFGGGGITALSSQMLSNSDFYTGAFPSEFGNALSGVFDMRIRPGNNEKREQTVKAGIIGIDFATEGPFAMGKKSSYLLNYRYSTLSLISPLLPENAQGLNYQDLSFKFNFPAGKSGVLSAWGLFSSDRTGSKVKKDSSEWKYYQDIQEDVNRNRMGAFGLNYKILLSGKAYINAALATTGNYIFWHRKQLNADLVLVPKDEISQNDRKYTFSFLLNQKFGARHTNRTGFTLNRLAYEVRLRQSQIDGGGISSIADDQGQSNLFQIYTQSRFALGNNITVNGGIHSQVFSLNHEITLEPRLSVNWKISKNHSLSIAYGNHSRMEPLAFYLTRQVQNGQRVEPNRSLRLSKARHMVISYEISTGENSRLLIEPFYQQLYDVPVIRGNSFSMQNLEIDWFFNDSLVNEGTGYNAGVDMTLERFLYSGYYYLFTCSLFDSRYIGGDGVNRDSRFNKKFVFNFLFGKEWTIGKQKNNILGINGKFSVLGGDRITPVDYAATSAAKEVILDDRNAFKNRKSDVYFLDFSASWKINRQRYSGTWSVQCVNLLFQKEFYGYRYNFRKDVAEPLKEIVVIPSISYRIDF